MFFERHSRLLTAKDALGCPQFSAAAPGVGFQFDVRRGDYFFIQDAQPGGVAAAAFREIRRADAIDRFLLHEAFHDAVFQRVIADDDQPPAEAQQARRLLEGALQAGKFLINGDA